MAETGVAFYRFWARLSLALFLGMAAVHVLALLGFYAPPPAALVPVFLFVFAGQAIVILTFQDRTPEKAWKSTGKGWRAIEEGLKVIPVGWRVLAGFLWFLYLPGTFFGSLVASRGAELNEGVFTAEFALFLAVFSLVHYLVLGFVYPKKEEIAARVGLRG